MLNDLTFSTRVYTFNIKYSVQGIQAAPPGSPACQVDGLACSLTASLEDGHTLAPMKFFKHSTQVFPEWILIKPNYSDFSVQFGVKNILKCSIFCGMEVPVPT